VFENRDGISNIQILCKNFYNAKEKPNYYGRLVISGKSKAVDELMIEIKNWLSTCQTMHYDKIY